MTNTLPPVGSTVGVRARVDVHGTDGRAWLTLINADGSLVVVNNGGWDRAHVVVADPGQIIPIRRSPAPWLDFRIEGMPTGKPGLFVKRFGRPCPVCKLPPNAVVAPRTSKKKPDPRAEWGKRIAAAFEWHFGRAGVRCLDEPFRMDLDFTIGRPASHFGTGRNAGVLKASAPTRHFVKPDRDNLIKFLKDAVTPAGLWSDDCLDDAGSVTKRWSDGRVGSVRVRIWRGSKETE